MEPRNAKHLHHQLGVLGGEAELGGMCLGNLPDFSLSGPIKIGFALGKLYLGDFTGILRARGQVGKHAGYDGIEL